MPDTSATIIDLPARIDLLPPQQRRRVLQLFQAALATGEAVVPEPMRAWAEQHFGTVGSVERQQVLRVCNRATLDEALFNPLRARRPVEQTDGDIEHEIAARLADGDIFAHPRTMTTADIFGRVEGRFCISASNVAKFDGWHGLVIFDEPHPLRFGTAQVCDYLDVARRWLLKAHAAEPAARYPLMIWNCLPRSGATMVHGHMQMVLGSGQHYAQVERWRRAALAYGQAHGQPGCAAYFDDLHTAHSDLGLACYEHASVRGFASLTPSRNREVVLLAPEPGPALDAALAVVLRALIDGQGVHAFNAAVYLPPLTSTPEDWHGFPAIARVADRGNPLSRASDLGAIEIFASNVITADPYEVARLLRQAADREAALL